MISSRLLPQIQHHAGRKLVGMRTIMSLTDPKTPELWKKWMPRRKEIQHTCSEDFISMSIYPPHYFQLFQPDTLFEKWAAVEVSEGHNVPEGMETYHIPAGLYAVFHYRGWSHDPSIFQDIYSQWLPASDYVLDPRPHYEVLGEKYKNHDPDSEEDIWIPVRPK